MKRESHAALVLAFALSTWALAQQPSKGPSEVGNRKQLFINTHGKAQERYKLIYSDYSGGMGGYVATSADGIAPSMKRCAGTSSGSWPPPAAVSKGRSAPQPSSRSIRTPCGPKCGNWAWTGPGSGRRPAPPDSTANVPPSRVRLPPMAGGRKVVGGTQARPAGARRDHVVRQPSLPAKVAHMPPIV